MDLQIIWVEKGYHCPSLLYRFLCALYELKCKYKNSKVIFARWDTTFPCKNILGLQLILETPYYKLLFLLDFLMHCFKTKKCKFEKSEVENLFLAYTLKQIKSSQLGATDCLVIFLTFFLVRND